MLNRIRLILYQVYCGWAVGRHTWGARHIDLPNEVPGYKNPVVKVCSRCGKAKVFSKGGN